MDKEAIGFLIVLVGLFTGLSIPIVALVLGYRQRCLLIQLHHQQRMAAIEKGVDLPAVGEGFFQGDLVRARPAKQPHRYLLVGLVWFLASLGFFMALSMTGDRSSGLGLVGMGVGSGYLIFYFVVGRHLPNEGKDRVNIAKG